jgi:hypothetical protein
MTETTTQDPQVQELAGVELDAVDEQLAARLVAQARSNGISLVGPDGLLQRVTKLVLEGALTDHLGYVHGDPAGRNSGNPRGRQDRATRRQLPRVATSFGRFSPDLAEALLYLGWWLSGAAFATYHREMLPAQLPRWRPLPS